MATCATRAFEIFPYDRGLSVSVVATLRNLSLAGIVSFAGLFFNGTIQPVYIAMIIVCLVVYAAGRVVFLPMVDNLLSVILIGGLTFLLYLAVFRLLGFFEKEDIDLFKEFFGKFLLKLKKTI